MTNQTHTSVHPLHRQAVQIKLAGSHPQLDDLNPYIDYNFEIEDWADRLYGKTIWDVSGNPAVLFYAVHAGLAGLPTDDDTVYGKIDGRAYIFHTSELILSDEQRAVMSEYLFDQAYDTSEYDTDGLPMSPENKLLHDIFAEPSQDLLGHPIGMLTQDEADDMLTSEKDKFEETPLMSAAEARKFNKLHQDD